MRPRALTAGVLAAALLTGCAQSVDPIERLSRKAAQRVRTHGPAAQPAYRRWGLTAPLGPAPGAAARPPVTGRAGRGPLPVVDRIPTRDRVVFLTYDDGAGKDRRFVDMVRELRLPVSVFSTGGAVGPGRGRFARLRSAGATVQHRTLGRPAPRDLPYAARRAELCARQDELQSRFGTRPRLFRPPGGTYDTTTLRAAADCGLTAVVGWRVSVGAHGELAYTGGECRLRPGDIVSVPSPRAEGLPLRERTARLLRRVQERGLTVGRLEDYL